MLCRLKSRPTKGTMIYSSYSPLGFEGNPCSLKVGPWKEFLEKNSNKELQVYELQGWFPQDQMISRVPLWLKGSKRLLYKLESRQSKAGTHTKLYRLRSRPINHKFSYNALKTEI